MKLKTRLKLSFFIIAIMPVLMLSVILGGLLTFQSRDINSQYGIDGDELTFISNPVDIVTEIADNLHGELQKDLNNNPELMEDMALLQELSLRLQEKSTDLVVRRNGEYIFLSEGITREEAQEMLPNYGEINDVSENGVYYGGKKQCFIRQIDMAAENGDEYSISLISYLDDIVPRLKIFWSESIVAVVIVLIVISAVMTIWIYRATIIPLNKLKEAARNISEGNLDFEVEIDGDDEISELCRDFEFMRQKLKETAEEKLQSDKESKELISNISHDLKTPITAIKGYVEGLRDGVAVTEEKRDKYLKTIYNKAIEMDRLIDELTLYSKIDTNRIPYSFNRISCGDFFDDCSDSLVVELEAKGVDFSYENKLEDDIEIIADTEQLSRVINNIISNSLKYHADRKIKICMRIMDEGDFIRVEMEDNGKGISKNDLPNIFTRLYRADASRNSATGGSGIGLAIVKKIIEDHGGRIWAESREGEGTNMCFVLRKYIGGSHEQNINN